MEELKGTVFNIQKFSITDGVGIRTLVFMKGCPLRCLWCSNPESQKSGVEIMYVKTNCIGCGYCASACPQGAVDAVAFDIDRDRCIACGDCTKRCYANAKKIVGKQYTIHDLMEKVNKDRIFYQNSGGGVTVGGGEPLLQAAFVAEFLRECQRVNIHTAIETCGYCNWQSAEPVFTHTDQIFYDLKLFDSKRHKTFTGAGNELILENAVKVSRLGKETVFRVPLIKGINDDEQNLEATAAFVNDRAKDNPLVTLEILPYHSYGRDKYKWLNREYPLEGKGSLTAEELKEKTQFLKNNGVHIVSDNESHDVV